MTQHRAPTRTRPAAGRRTGRTRRPEATTETALEKTVTQASWPPSRTTTSLCPMLLISMMLGTVAVATASAYVSPCPLTHSTNIVYSKASGVGGASQIWIEDMLWWMHSADPSLQYIGLLEEEIQVDVGIVQSQGSAPRPAVST